MKLHTGDMVRVKWDDAFGLSSAWSEDGEIDPDATFPVETVGYVVAVGKRSLVLSRDKSEGQRGGVFYIPHGFIRSIRRVRVKK